MRLDVHRNGVKLFFITFAVVGRQPILSQLVDEKSRPALLPLGEWVKEALLAIHQVWSAAGDKCPLLAVLIAADGLASRILETK